MPRKTPSPTLRPVVAIGSRNQAKVEGIRKAFSHFIKDAEFRKLDLTRHVKIQPLSLDETVEGARLRAEFAIEEEEADYGVGVEAGIIALAQGEEGQRFFLNVQIAAVIDSARHISFGSSSGFPIPSRFVSLLEGKEVELDRFAHELTGAKKVTEKEGVIYRLSKRKLSRVEMTEQCVSMALIPWLNKGVFGLE